MSKNKKDNAAAKSIRKKPVKRKRSHLLDLCLGVFGGCLAGVSSFLPYYVYTNTAKFGPPEMQFTGRVDYGGPQIEVEPESEYVERRKPLFQNIRQARLPPQVELEPQEQTGETTQETAQTEFQEIDPTVTGSINPEETEFPSLCPKVRPSPAIAKVETPETDPVAHDTLVLVFASRGRALIQDGSDLLPVAIGSRLPDGSTVKSLTKQADGWQLLTTDNHIMTLVN